MIIIPDIHGRDFWKDAVSQAEKNELVIFLGDYMDPYKNEHIDRETTIENLEEIISYKKSNKDNCILLLGNHDTEYIYGTSPARMDYDNIDRIVEIFVKNRDLFQIAHYINSDDGKLSTFSHSFISKGWKDEYFGEDITVTDVIGRLNSLHKEDNKKELFRLLDVVSWRRSDRAWCDYGSIIWSDLNELDFVWGKLPVVEFENVTQYFGHTQLVIDNALQMPGYVDLDCRRAFRLDLETNELYPITKEIHII